MIKTRLQYWRFQHQYKFIKDFAEYLNQPYVQYSKWENNKVEISLEKLVEIWKVIKIKFPDTKLEDLLEIE